MPQIRFYLLMEKNLGTPKHIFYYTVFPAGISLLESMIVDFMQKFAMAFEHERITCGISYGIRANNKLTFTTNT